MKKLYSLLLLGGLLFFGVENSMAAKWVGASAINVNGSWYKGTPHENNAWVTNGEFNGKDLGVITSLALGGQSEFYDDGVMWANGSTMTMYYKIDEGSIQTVTLKRFKDIGNNNVFESRNNDNTDFESCSVDISGLSAGKHTLAIWFMISKGYEQDYYDSNNSNNYNATFYIASSVTLNSFGYATFCGANNYEISGATAYKASLSPEGDVLNLSSISGVIPAGVGIILGGTAGATATISYTGEDATSVSGNVLRGTTSSQTTTSLYSEGQTFYAYDKSDNKFKIYNGTNFPANKAYFIVESGAGSAPSAIRIEFEENNATSIDAIEANEKAMKFIENGKLLILKDGVVYDATGRVVR